MDTNGTSQEHRGTFSENRAAKRQITADRLASRIVRPVPGQVFASTFVEKERSGKNHTRISVGVAATLHAALIAASVVSGLRAEPVDPTRETKIVFYVPPKETPAPEPAEALPEPPPEPVSLPPIVEKPRPVRKPPPPDPVSEPPEAARPERRVIGLSMASTVTNESGPGFATGNTRMGRTEALSGRDPGPASGRGVPAGRSDESPNRAALSVPGQQRSFVKPTRLSNAEPSYPSELKYRGIEGTVVVMVAIDAEGAVRDVRVLKSSGYPEFDDAAKGAALKDRYSPAESDGSSVEYNLRYTYRFRIRGA